jgi:hypothetical protein
MTHWRELAALLLCSACSAPTASSQEAAPPRVNLQGVLSRIRQHAADDAWRKQGLADAQIEGWLDKLAGSIATAAKMPELKVPVRLADVRPIDAAPSRTVSQRLLVGQNLDLKDVRLQNSIVLADGNVAIESAEGCVIVARGAVRLQQSSYCVIVSGLCVEVSSDGQPNDTANGSIIATRGWASLRIAYGSFVAAPEGATVESPRDVFIVNAAIASGEFESASAKTLQVPDLPLEPLAENPLRAQLKVLGIVRPDTAPIVRAGPPFGRPRGGAPPPPADLGIVVRFGGRRYLAAIGQPILDEAGRVVEPLRDWQLATLTDSLAIFSSSASDLALRLPGR